MTKSTTAKRSARFIKEVRAIIRRDERYRYMKRRFEAAGDIDSSILRFLKGGSSPSEAAENIANDTYHEFFLAPYFDAVDINFEAYESLGASTGIDLTGARCELAECCAKLSLRPERFARLWEEVMRGLLVQKTEVAA